MRSREESGNELLMLARQHEGQYDLETAHVLYVRAANALKAERSELGHNDDDAARVDELLDAECLALMRAGQCLEMREPWRAHTAVWERLGNTIGNSIDVATPFRTPSEPGQHETFHVIPVQRWASGLEQAEASDREFFKRQQQAWAYSWAALEAESNGQNILAARLYRKAGVAWSDNADIHVGDGQGDVEVLGAEDPERMYLADAHGFWREAARCFYRASICALRSDDATSMAMVAEGWIPAQNEWGRDAAEPLPTAAPALSDLERIRVNWAKYLAREKRTTPPARSRKGLRDSTYFKSHEDQARQLLDIQRSYAQVGDRRHAIGVYRERQRLRRRTAKIARQRTVAALRSASMAATCEGSSLWRALMSAAALYVVVFPVLFAATGLLGIAGGSSPGVMDYMLFSLGNVVSVTSERYVTESFLISALQAFEALSGYAVLGYLLWVALRSYEA